MKQSVCVDHTGLVEVTLKASRLGRQEKYISAIGRNGEIDIKLLVEVVQLPELVCARNYLTVRQPGVYKIPIKLTSYADSNDESVEFDLTL